MNCNASPIRNSVNGSMFIVAAISPDFNESICYVREFRNIPIYSSYQINIYSVGGRM